MVLCVNGCYLFTRVKPASEYFVLTKNLVEEEEVFLITHSIEEETTLQLLLHLYTYVYLYRPQANKQVFFLSV